MRNQMLPPSEGCLIPCQQVSLLFSLSLSPGLGTGQRPRAERPTQCFIGCTGSEKGIFSLSLSLSLSLYRDRRSRASPTPPRADARSLLFSLVLSLSLSNEAEEAGGHLPLRASFLLLPQGIGGVSDAPASWHPTFHGAFGKV